MRFSDMRNQQMSNQNNVLVDIAQRCQQEINNNIAAQRSIAAAVVILKKRIQNKEVPSNVLKLMTDKAGAMALKNAIIDDSFQRSISVKSIVTIIGEFKPMLFTAGQVWVNPDTGLEYVYDGQHRILALYIILKEVYELSDEDIGNYIVPVVINDTMTYGELIERYISENGEGKEKLTPYDNQYARVSGYRKHNIHTKKFKLAAKIQDTLVGSDLFLVDPNKKTREENLPGAITRTDEVLRWPIEVIEWFCEYVYEVCGKSVTRPLFAPHESGIMGNIFFKNCYHAEVNMTPELIKEIADINAYYFNGDFAATGELNQLVRKSFVAWRDRPGTNTYRQNLKFGPDAYHYMLSLYKAKITNPRFVKELSKLKYDSNNDYRA